MEPRHVRPPCTLCGRVLRAGTTAHHLFPRSCHRNKSFQKRYTRDRMSATIAVCRDCHRAIYRFLPDEKAIARDFNTVEELRSHEGLARFITRVRKQR